MCVCGVDGLGSDTDKSSRFNTEHEACLVQTRTEIIKEEFHHVLRLP